MRLMHACLRAAPTARRQRWRKRRLTTTTDNRNTQKTSHQGKMAIFGYAGRTSDIWSPRFLFCDRYPAPQPGLVSFFYLIPRRKHPA